MHWSDFLKRQCRIPGWHQLGLSAVRYRRAGQNLGDLDFGPKVPSSDQVRTRGLRQPTLFPDGDMVTTFSSRNGPKRGTNGELICDEVSPASEPSKTQEARSKSWSKYSSE